MSTPLENWDSSFYCLVLCCWRQLALKLLRTLVCTCPCMCWLNGVMSVGSWTVLCRLGCCTMVQTFHTVPGIHPSRFHPRLCIFILPADTLRSYTLHSPSFWCSQSLHQGLCEPRTSLLTSTIFPPPLLCRSSWWWGNTLTLALPSTRSWAGGRTDVVGWSGWCGSCLQSAICSVAWCPGGWSWGCSVSLCSKICGPETHPPCPFLSWSLKCWIFALNSAGSSSWEWTPSHVIALSWRPVSSSLWFL